MTDTSKTGKIFYWIATILLCAFAVFAAYNHITGSEEIRANVNRLGFPARLMPFLGVLKILGVITIIIGAKRDITVGAYAGFVFYALGAMATHITANDALQNLWGSVMLLVLALASYFLWKRYR